MLSSFRIYDPDFTGSRKYDSDIPLHPFPRWYRPDAIELYFTVELEAISDSVFDTEAIPPTWKVRSVS
jgi:hypothetical protein